MHKKEEDVCRVTERNLKKMDFKSEGCGGSQRADALAGMDAWMAMSGALPLCSGWETCLHKTGERGNNQAMVM